MSKRQEDFQEKANSYANKCGGTTQERCATMTDYFAGCEYGYQYAIDKACEWLADRVAHDSIDYPMATEHLIDNFRNAMEE